MKEFTSIDSQRGRLNISEIIQGLKELVDGVSKSISGLLTLDSLEDDLNALFFLIHEGNFPQMSEYPVDRNERFYRKQSYAQEEWCMSVNELVRLENSLPLGNILKSIYESNKVNFWTNDDDFSHYRMETLFEGRRLVVIFYNSSDKHRRKLSFEELLQKNEPIRICWY